MIDHLSQRAAQIRQATHEQAQALLHSLPIPVGSALVATGSYARREMTAYSDLDIFLLQPSEGTSAPPVTDHRHPAWQPHHPTANNRPPSTVQPPEALAADTIGYALWDSQFRVDFVTRTQAQCISLVASDIPAALALLDMEYIAGDRDLFDTTRRQVLRCFRQLVAKNFPAILECANARWTRSGSVVSMTRPDVKNGRGGLRDDELGTALRFSQLADYPTSPAHREALIHARQLLVDVRCLLHDSLRRHRDIVEPAVAVDIARELHLADRYTLATVIGKASHHIDRELQRTIAQVRSVLPRDSHTRNTRKPLDTAVVDAGGYVSVTTIPHPADPAAPGFALRVAAAASRAGLPVARPVWDTLAHLPTPAAEAVWRQDMREDFLTILAHPESVITTVTALDEAGLWQRYLPEWGNVRALLPREPSHVHTVDLHLLHTVQQCGQVSFHSPRPDLLLLAGLLHDIGKGTNRPHAQVGAEIAAKTGHWIGLNQADTSILQTLVAEHTLLFRLATKYAPDSPTAIDTLLDACHYHPLTLELLGRLTKADAIATGPNQWNKRIAMTVETLLAGARRELTPPVPQRPFFTVPPTQLVQCVYQAGEPVVFIKTAAKSEVVRMLALIRSQGLLITDYVMATRRSTPQAGGGDNTAGAASLEKPVRTQVLAGDAQPCIDARIRLRNTLGSALDVQRLTQLLRHAAKPKLPPVPPAPVMVHWYNPTLAELRTVDRPGVTAALLELVEDFHWSAAATPGSTIIARVQLPVGTNSHQFESAVVKALSGSQF
ncbi:HD domain-containing protein [Corynebacterium choanae]|uniref:Bifunctional uridylyltransferase/uridylyl-removing enzyme n=1 Tax=Corynebacterium choanae TaxID=1862358 RepID=A0A3G6J7Y8_9CORY|nr:HD domain-containing protein [Corynebacterium choanae]AZA13893.1 Bifunctional uridylyltransferase/uridylyl-removing enzyme [Corynebacterium choanae]